MKQNWGAFSLCTDNRRKVGIPILQCAAFQYKDEPTIQADANIQGQQKVVQTTSIVKEPAEGPYYIDLQDTSIPDRCLLFPLQSLRLNAIDSTTPYAIMFFGTYEANKSSLGQYFSSSISELIPKKDFLGLYFNKSYGFNKFPSITFHFRTAHLVPAKCYFLI
ncbi:hypothetical protein NE237_031743 [Protea cynaroides]|uniref:Uncharacterized protein n=1 Tax=Protea cynaroides TaxID=273540 RepID=A0A9Q0L254_9MAGN|nr:hypothetical protein NE237_031743 [Protea cynaroides]